MRTVFNLLFLLILTASFFVWNGCASSKKTVQESDSSAQTQSSQDDYDEIEKLLGISREEPSGTDQQKTQQPQTTTAKNESGDDLIKLLEVDETKKKNQAPSQQTTGSDKRLTRLQDQVDDLRTQLKKKDMEIADLKAQLMMRDDATGSTSDKSASQSNFYRSMNKPAASSASRSSAPSDYVSKYDQGLSLFHDRHYREALSTFEQLLSEDTNNDYSDNAQYWLGECYYAMGRYKEAIMAFEKVFTFRYSNKDDYAQFKIGQCYFMLGEKQRARQEFQQLLDNYPKTALLGRARDYLAQL
jgi:TolA-binding protein